MKIGDKVRILTPSEGKVHFGVIEDIVKDMFSKEPLYLLKVRLKDGVKTMTYAETSLTPVKSRKRSDALKKGGEKKIKKGKAKE